MGKYNICVYAICKNEEQFADRWMDSMLEADRVVVLDTGSDDRTVERLRARGAEVTAETITPWRFDTARNRSLELVPQDTDICVCTDLDEVFHPGWRKELEKVWVPGRDRPPTGIHGPLTPTAPRAWYSGMRRSTPVTATSGSIRSTRC